MRQALSEGKVSVETLDYERRSPLMIAATAGHAPIVDLLIQEKASLNSRDMFGNTALSNAVRMGHRAVAEALHTAGAELGGRRAAASTSATRRAAAS